MVKILQKESVVLRETARKVRSEEIGTQKLNSILKDMREALASQEDGVAIAAPQIGIPLRIFVVSGKIFTNEEDEKVADDKIFINPKITKISKKKEDMDEGCLSVRWKYGLVSRSVKCTVKALDENGTFFSHNASGLLSQIFQHETDHLVGVLFTDTATNVQDIHPEDLKKRNS